MCTASWYSCIPSWKQLTRWNFWHWSISISDTDHSKTVPAVHAVDARCFFGHKYKNKQVQHMLQVIPFSPFSHLLRNKDSPAPAALAASAGHSLLPFPIQLHPLFPHIMVGTKMPSRETFKSNMTITPTKRYVDCNAASWFLTYS